MSTEPLLTTKLYTPSPHTELVPRPRLTKRLAQGLNRKLTLLSAPAGFGKTTLMSEWLNQMVQKPTPSPVPVAWLSLDEGDNDPARFWAYIIAALETVQPGLGESALALLRSPQLPPLASVVTLLANDLAAVPHDFILVLDDYHVIEAHSLHESLTFLLDHLPPQMHLFITSRTDPPLPLARLRVRRQLVELRAEDLRFTAAEAAVFLNEIMGLNLKVEDVAALEARTEGWIAGLQLAAVSMQNQDDVAGFIQAFTGSHRYILDYLAEEVLLKQPQEIQRFLLQTSILDRLTASLCNAVTGRDDGQIILDRLAQANLFLVALDDQRRWYRYHRLFADLLRHRLVQDQAGQALEAHRRAAIWHEQEGFGDDAVKHALAAQDFDRAGRLVEQRAEAMIMRGELAVLRRWLAAFPPTLRESRPQLGLIEAWVLFLGGELQAAGQCLQEVRQLLGLAEAESIETPKEEQSPETQAMLAQATALQAQLALMQGNVSHSIALSCQALDHLPEEALALRSVVTLNLGLAYLLNGDVEAADQTMAELKVMSQARGDPTITMITSSNLAQMQLIQGRLHQTALLYRRVLQLGPQQIPYTAGRAHVGLGRVLYEWNDLAGAAHHFQEGIALSQQAADIQNLVVGYAGLAQVFQAQGNLEDALATMQQIKDLVPKLGPGLLPDLIRAFQARLWLAQGNLTAARQWSQVYNVSHEAELDSLHEFEYTTLARVLIAQGDLDQAEILLGRLLQIVEATGWLRSAIEIRTLQALARQARRQTVQAVTILQEALALAEPEGYIRLFVDEGSPMAALLLKLLETRPQTGQAAPQPAPDYVRKLLTALGVGSMLPPDDKPAGPNQALVEPLTGRELEVLTLIAAGLSNQDIAGRLIIAPSTVKTHAKNIYGKLGVKSRIQAVARAKELNLL